MNINLIINANGFYPLFSIECKNKNEHKILSAFSSTKKVFNNPNIFFTCADKGNTVVAMDRMVYVAKMEEIFSNNNTYISLQFHQ